MTKLMEGKAGLVTGAGGGIGRASALAFSREGAKVMVSDFNEETGKETVKLIRDAGGEAEFFKCDVSDEEQVKALVEATVSTFGKLDFAHNNAAITSPNAPIGELDTAGLDHVLKVNLYSVFYCLKYQVNAMEQNGGGAIVNTASTSGMIGNRNITPYNASKFGVVGVTRSAAMEYGKKGIRVNAISPGMTMTPMIQDFYEKNPAYFKQLEAAIPLGSIAEPEDQANAAVWLCSNQARMITGVILPVDGGSLAGQ
ncbi:SDR family NAD(P)-dependent oxidoreductase [Neobacillus vireti]|uniref:SDR family NAD(P)-dependent oxidoreductase n=1 Tax=Neobacillus vireti TaxID=220686 RepID=UPI002FFEFB12